MEPRSAGVWRRLAAASYDGLLLLAVLMVVTALLQLATHGAAIDLDDQNRRGCLGPLPGRRLGDQMLQALLQAGVQRGQDGGLGFRCGGGGLARDMPRKRRERAAVRQAFAACFGGGLG